MLTCLKCKTIFNCKCYICAFRLRLLAKDIKKEEEEWAHAKEKRAKKKSVEGNRTKQLGKRKFEEHELEFNRPHELTGNLRSLKTEGSILMDRFHSFQKRNMLEVTAKQLKYVIVLSEHCFYFI